MRRGIELFIARHPADEASAAVSAFSVGTGQRVSGLVSRCRRGGRALVAALGVFILGSVVALSGRPALAGNEPQPLLPTIEVLVGGVPLTVEVASGSEQRYMGLSFREQLDGDAGMLFVYPDERPLTFTMRNTLLPLSIAFIDEGLVVREIIDMDVGPGQLFDSDRPARYALEVNQGWFERNDVAPGATVTMP